MSQFALVLVLIAALVHAAWNLLAKRAGGGALFVWLFSTLSSIFLVPVGIIYLWFQGTGLSAVQLGFILGTTLLHLVYFLLLLRAYQSGDLSLVYPIARGLGPALATIGAVLVLDERPTMVAIVGLLLITSGMVLLTARGSSAMTKDSKGAIIYGVLTGISIAAYSVWDKLGVSRFDVAPLVLESFTGMGVSLLLTPAAVRSWEQTRALWQERYREAIGVAILAPLSYILILSAMRFTPLSYVAPCREISILFTAVLGARFLGEGDVRRRIFAACLMAAGVVALAIG